MRQRHYSKCSKHSESFNRIYLITLLLGSLRSAGFRAGVTCALQVTLTLPVCTPLGPPNGTRFPSRESRPAAPNCLRTLLLRVVLIMPLRALSSKGPTIPPRSPNRPNRPPTDPTRTQPPANRPPTDGQPTSNRRPTDVQPTHN